MKHDGTQKYVWETDVNADCFMFCLQTYVYVFATRVQTLEDRAPRLNVQANIRYRALAKDPPIW